MESPHTPTRSQVPKIDLIPKRREEHPSSKPSGITKNTGRVFSASKALQQVLKDENAESLIRSPEKSPAQEDPALIWVQKFVKELQTYAAPSTTTCHQIPPKQEKNTIPTPPKALPAKRRKPNLKIQTVFCKPRPRPAIDPRYSHKLPGRKEPHTVYYRGVSEVNSSPFGGPLHTASSQYTPPPTALLRTQSSRNHMQQYTSTPNESLRTHSPRNAMQPYVPPSLQAKPYPPRPAPLAAGFCASSHSTTYTAPLPSGYHTGGSRPLARPEALAHAPLSQMVMQRRSRAVSLRSASGEFVSVQDMYCEVAAEGPGCWERAAWSRGLGSG